MKNKILMILSLVILFIFIVSFQLFVINRNLLFGIKPNLILITVIVISAWFGIKTGTISSFIIGTITDLIFGTKGMFLFSYVVVSLIVGNFNDKYNKENSISLVYVTIISTFIFELIQYLIYAITCKVYANFLYFIKQVTISSVLNIIIVLIIYSILGSIARHFENKIRKDLSGF